MTPDQITNQGSVVIPPAVAGLVELDKKITKLEKRKTSRSTLFVFGIVIVALWALGAFSAYASTSADPSSVAMLGPILTAPFLIIGIILGLIGAVGKRTAIKHLSEAQHAHQILLASLQGKA